MAQLRLTIHLYPVDEVIMTFKQCILQKRNIHETLFWLWELIYSEENIERLLEEIYLDFYASLNPSMYTYIKLKRKKYYKTKDKKELANIVSNLRIAFSGSDSFILNYYSENPDLCFPLKIYKKPKWLENLHELKEHKVLIPLILSIHYYNLKNISYYLYLILVKNKYDVEIIYKQIIGYFNFKNTSKERLAYVDKIWNENLILHNSKCISMIIFYLVVSESKLNKSTKYIAVDDRIIDDLEKHYNIFTGHISEKLKEKRIYATHDRVGPGHYGRFGLCKLTDDDINNISTNEKDKDYDEQTYKLKIECCYYWEYYSKSTLYWRKIFSKYKITFDIQKNIHFQKDELMEEFYERNGLDFDEQSIETQEKSIHRLYVEHNPFIWFNQL
jgi:hypothetical protein